MVIFAKYQNNKFRICYQKNFWIQKVIEKIQSDLKAMPVAK